MDQIRNRIKIGFRLPPRAALRGYHLPKELPILLRQDRSQETAEPRWDPTVEMGTSCVWVDSDWHIPAGPIGVIHLARHISEVWNQTASKN